MAKEKVFGVKPKVEIKETSKVEQYEMFTLVTRSGKTQIAVTNKIVSRAEFDSIEAAKGYIDSKPWELIVNATLVVADLTKEDRENKQ